MHTLFRTIVFSISLLLTGCCIFNQNFDSTSLERKGRFSVRVSVGENREFFSGKFHILFNSNSTHIFLYGPLGIMFAKITENNQYASLEKPNQEIIMAKNTDELIKKIFGFNVPLQFFSEWLKKELLSNPPSTKPSTTLIHNNWEVIPIEKDGLIKKITFQPIYQHKQNSFVITLIID